MRPTKIDAVSGGTLILAAVAFAICATAQAAVQTVKTGIASPQSDAEIGNAELLRARAIKNAMDLALLEVMGSVVSSELTSEVRSTDTSVVHNGKGTTATKEASRFVNNSLTRTEGHVRVLDVVKEWLDGNQYHVTVKLEVLEPAEATEKVGAGFFWERIGKPGILLTVTESMNDRPIEGGDPYTLRFFRDTLVNNALEPESGYGGGSRYQIAVTQESTFNTVPNFGTVAARCNLSYRISDAVSGKTLKEERLAHGPQAGFTTDKAKRDCLARIAPRLGEGLIRSLASIFNDQWNEGDEFIVRVSDVPATRIDVVMDAVKQVHRLKRIQIDGYNGGDLAMTVRYLGKSAELARAIGDVVGDIGHRVVPETISSNTVELRWLDTTTN